MSLVVPQGETRVIDVSPGRLARVRVLEGDLLLLDGQSVNVGEGWESYGQIVRAVVVTAMGADAVVEYGSVA